MREKLKIPDINPNFMGNGIITIHKFAKEDNYDHLLTLLLYADWRQLDIDIANNEGNTALHIAAKV